MVPLRALSLLLAVCTIHGFKKEKVDMLMPQVAPQKADTYLCIPLKLKDINTYIVGFEPHANKKVAHHMLLYGCDAPGADTEVWNCGGMEHPSGFKSAGTCSGGNRILYAWAYDAPGLTLPKDAGFMVGGETGINYLVLQIHYKDVSNFLPPKNEKDSSGVTLVTTDVVQPNRAGVMLLGTGGRISGHSTEYFEAACEYDEKFPVYPFAYRTHAHTHGRVVSGYVIKDGQWTEIGRKDPRLPEMFYDTTSPGVSIKPGDYMAARCTMVNDEDRTVGIGATHMDEMCNFYIMFYTPGRNTTAKTCWSPGPPTYYWDKWDNAKKFHPENAPKTVSVDPDTGKEYEITSRKAKPVVRDEPIEESLVDSLASRYVPNSKRAFARMLRKLDASYRKQYNDPLY